MKRLIIQFPSSFSDILSLNAPYPPYGTPLKILICVHFWTSKARLHTRYNGKLVIQCNLIFTLNDKKCQWSRISWDAGKMQADVCGDVAGWQQCGRYTQAVLSSASNNSSLEQCFSTFVRQRPRKFFCHKTEARSQQIYSSVSFQFFFLSSCLKLT